MPQEEMNSQYQGVVSVTGRETPVTVPTAVIFTLLFLLNVFYVDQKAMKM